MATMSLTISGILAIILGLLVLFVPGLVRWAVGIWLIVSGILSLIG